MKLFHAINQIRINSKFSPWSNFFPGLTRLISVALWRGRRRTLGRFLPSEVSFFSPRGWLFRGWGGWNCGPGEPGLGGVFLVPASVSRDAKRERIFLLARRRIRRPTLSPPTRSSPPHPSPELPRPILPRSPFTSRIRGAMVDHV